MKAKNKNEKKSHKKRNCNYYSIIFNISYIVRNEK